MSKRQDEHSMRTVRTGEHQDPDSMRNHDSSGDGDGNGKIDIAAFKDWITVTASAMPSLRKDMLAGIEHCDAQDLSEMIAIVRQAELSCLVELRDFHHNARAERQQQASSARQSARQQRMRAIVYTEVAGSWDQKIKWLQEVRRCLVEEQRRCAGARVPIG